MRCNSPTSNYTRQPWKLSSVCAVLRVLRHPGWMDLPRRSKPVNMKLMLPAGVRAATEPRFQGRTAGQSAVGDLSINADSKTKMSFRHGKTNSHQAGLEPTQHTSLAGWGGPGFFAVEFSQKSCIWIWIWFRIWTCSWFALWFRLWIRFWFWFESELEIEFWTDDLMMWNRVALWFVSIALMSIALMLTCLLTWQWLIWQGDFLLTSTRLHLITTGVADWLFRTTTPHLGLKFRIDKYRFLRLIALLSHFSLCRMIPPEHHVGTPEAVIDGEEDPRSLQAEDHQNHPEDLSQFSQQP